MANYVAQFLEENPNLARLPQKPLWNGLFFELEKGVYQGFIGGTRVHYFDGKEWKPSDTTLQPTTNNRFGINGNPFRVARDGTVNLNNYNHNTHQITTIRGTVLSTFGEGLLNDNELVFDCGTFVKKQIILEAGYREEIVITKNPGVRFINIETSFEGISATDGDIEAIILNEFRSEKPVAYDINNKFLSLRRYISNNKLVVTVDLQDASYPVTIDPDFLADSSDGYIRAINATYATARATSTDFNTTGLSFFVGQTTGYTLYRALFKFETSGLFDLTVTQANIKMAASADSSTTNFDVIFKKYDWSASDPISTSNRDTIYDGILAAAADDNIWRNTNGMALNTPYTSGNLNTAWINTEGYTYYGSQSNRENAGTVPTNAEFIQINSSTAVTAANRPYLLITATGDVSWRFSQVGLQVDVNPADRTRRISQAGIHVDIDLGINRVFPQVGLDVDANAPAPRISQTGLEVDANSPSPRFSQAGLEVDANSPAHRFTELGVEADINLESFATFDQVGLQIDANVPSPRFSQIGIEIDILIPNPYVIPVYIPPEQYAQALYSVKLYDWEGRLKAIFDTWKDLQVEHTVNSYSTHVFSIDATDPRRNFFLLDSILEVNRKVGRTGPWYQEYVGFHRSPQSQLTEGMHRIFTSYGRGLLDLIHRKEIMYPARTPFTIKGGPAETVIKSFVNENAGPGASSALRYVKSPILGLSIQADGAQGLNWVGERSHKNLLDIIQEIALVSEIDFDVIWMGGQHFEFRTYAPMKGTDKTATVQFRPELGNMVSPSHTLSRTDEATIAVVLGQGQSRNRRFLVKSGVTVNDSPWNNIEITKDARNEETYAAYNSEADKTLKEGAPQESFTFEVMQTAASQYGREYRVGDLVTVGFSDIIRTKQIISAKIQVREQKESIDLEFSDYVFLR